MKTIDRIRAARDWLQVDLGRAPTGAEIGTHCGITRQRVSQVLAAAGEVTDAMRAEQRARAAAAEAQRRQQSAARQRERDAREAEVLKLHDAGCIQTEIARRIGLSQRWVSRVLQRHDKAAHFGGHRTWTFAEHVRMFRLRADGLTPDALAAEFDTSRNNVHAHLSRLQRLDDYACRVRAAASDVTTGDRAPVLERLG